MTFTLPDLPYPRNALEPHISELTMGFHYDKHHASYVDKLNKAVKGTGYAGQPLMDIVREAHGKGDAAVFNNGAQAWNHTFFWHSMAPGEPGRPDGQLADLIEDSFGSLEHLRTKFIGEGVGRFGSGWVWLVRAPEGGLSVVSTANAEMPQFLDLKPLLVCDLWEHAYYLDYRNDRQKFLQAFFDHLVNWEFAARNLAFQDADGALAA